MGLSIPVRIQGFEADGTTWNASASTADVSAGGASFPLGRDVALGQVLLLVLPLPQRLRQYDLNGGAYRVYALVRGIQNEGSARRVGTMFFGKFPPKGFVDRPWARFLLPSDVAPGGAAAAGSPPGAAPSAPAKAPAPPSRAPEAPSGLPGRSSPAPAVPSPGSDPKERRRYPRFSLFVNLTLQQVDEWGAVLQEELTVANSLGKGGAGVMTTLDLTTGDVVQIQEAGGGFATRAEIRAITRGGDGVERLHLRFIDRLVPDRLLDQP